MADKEHFEFDGEKYRNASRHQREWGNGLLNRLDLSGSEDVLDLGCGDGTLSVSVAQRVPNGTVLGVDASEGMLGAARSLKQSNLSFSQIDINRLDFEGQFDLVFSNAALHWVLDHKMLLEKAYNALRPGGRIAWNFAGAGTIPAFGHVIKDKIREPEYEEYFVDFVWPWYMPEEHEYRDLLAESPFQEYEIIIENIERYFSSADEMIRWIDQPTIVPFITRVPAEKRDTFRSAVVDDMLDRTRQPDGTYLERFTRINAIASKQSTQ